MRHASLPLLLLLALVAEAADVRAQAAPQVGTCTLGTAEAALDVNNVFGAVFNTGSLFFGNTLTNGDGYLVPKATGKSPIFASGIWIGGQVGGQLRVAGARYTNFNFWPGPLDAATGRPVNPASCRAYDRIYSVKRDDIRAYEAGGQFSQDLTDWPAQLGAPVVDGDGNLNNYNLAGGDRPNIIGDQGIWWVMNDVGAAHTGSNTPPLGVEVQVLAFAFARADALGSTTFYKYKIINKSGAAIQNTYVSVFSDPDLGNAVDDYVGSDVAAGLGYVYNADNDDASGYGLNPPAVGYDFFQGPIVPDGPDAGSAADTLGTSAFSYFINGGPAGTLDPTLGSAIYNFQQGLWGDGTEMRDIGNGYAQTAGNVTKFAFPGDPVTSQRWSEINNGSTAPLNAPGDRRLVVHTGPFTLNNGDAQDIVFGIVYARGTGNLASITALRAADRLAQRAYDINFALPSPPPAPALCSETTAGTGTCLSASSQNGQVILSYGYPSTSENFLGRYEVVNGFIVGQGFDDVTYNFEGFNIYRYPNANFAAEERQLVATYDVVNGVTEVRDLVFDPAIGDNNIAITARGTDSGVQYSFAIDGLTNFTDYYYGITAYAFNDNSSPKIIESQATNITVRPSGLTSGVRTQGVRDSTLTTTAIRQNGEGVITARIVDPSLITGATYEVVFFTNSDGTTNYSIRNTTTNRLIVDGADYFARTGNTLPQTENVVVAEGLSFSVTGPEIGFSTFVTTANAAGPLVPVDYGTAAFNAGADFPHASTGPYATPADQASPTPNQQVGPGTFLIQQGSQPADASFARFVERTTRAGANFEFIGSNDFEWRFTGSSTAIRNFSDQVKITVPFQLWNVGPTANTSDDYQLIAGMLPSGTPDTFDLGLTDHSISGGTNDPFTDLIYWYQPANTAPGSVGYNEWIAAGSPNPNGLAGYHEYFARTVLVGLNAGAVPGPYNQSVPEPGTILRIVTFKPNLAGDTFQIDSAPARLTEITPEGQEAALDRIAAVPNPYYGQSGYETGNLSRVVRFTNLPPQTTTIRIYTVSGSLVQTLRKDGGSRSLDWNLTTVNNLPVASGMYLVHVDVEGVGERTLKLGIVNRRSQVNVF